MFLYGNNLKEPLVYQGTSRFCLLKHYFLNKTRHLPVLISPKQQGRRGLFRRITVTGISPNQAVY